jgi:hypothetical protein
MTVSLATSGGRTLDIGLPGQLADETEPFVDTLINESETNGLDDAGLIDFGVAVAVGTADDGCKVVDSNADVVAGITTRMPLMPALPADSLIGYKTGAAVGVLRFGTIFATAVENVSAGDQVLAIVGSEGGLGGVTSGIAGTGRLVVTGARWLTTTTSGSVGKIEVVGRMAPVLTS